ncbi:hypothetical protein [Erythrobacter colymbi]|uniref:hypothetical protein n=1 Tax=Erythrobacter colymbi TaxID=1161202 RepID=UPI000A385281|nr:hypothetical protein [Erythrobacter colymbi]
MKAGLPLLALAAALTACAPAAKAPPVATAGTPAPRPPVVAAPARPEPLPAPVDMHWMDAPLTPGAWRYHSHDEGTTALFLATDRSGGFMMVCERASGRMLLWREGTIAGPRIMTIRTETATRTLRAAPKMETMPYAAADTAAGDPLLDAMALSKGRFAVEVEGLAPLILPSHAEVSRVIEDCR